MNATNEAQLLLAKFGLADRSNGDLVARSPIDGSVLACIQSDANIDAKLARSVAAFERWRDVPAPRRGELVRLFGEALRENKDALGRLVTLETGKILSEGLGEVQEMIDICDFAVGLSRQLYGLTIASERPDHHLVERWHPLGPVAVISAFNFPVAVFAWNAALALVCGNSVIWKPSEKTPLTALATVELFKRAAAKFGETPAGLLELVMGGRTVGETLVADKRVPLVSATGSTRMGREIAPVVAARFGRSLLELGGNAAMIVTKSADLDLATRAATFSAVGTCGQRCTTLRRLIVHKDMHAQLVDRLVRAYGSLRIGNPLSSDTLVGPLLDRAAYDAMQAAIKQAVAEGGTMRTGGERIEPANGDAFYVRPAIVDMPAQSAIVRHETFAPVLYVLTYETFDEALRLQNEVDQGLSSCIFSTDIRETERFLSAKGSDCGLANVNTGPSGAEIGGAFGGEKETGGGRESGSDAWKTYMRRQTQTVNWGTSLPLAQGVEFPVD
jgi:aldehyde dehydrogenase (NAD+)